MKQFIFAGIVTYNPEIERLQENIDAVLPQVQGLVLVDNASENISDIEKLMEQYKRVFVIKNTENKGIAAALNQIMEEAEKRDAGWVLTLDQDTVVYENLIEMYKTAVEEFCDKDDMPYDAELIASFTCLRKDRNFEEENRNGGKVDPTSKRKKKSVKDDGLYTEVETCITSGNLLNVAAWRDVDGFDERFFIDMVDDEFCFRLREHGYSILRVNEYGYLHELGGNLKKVKLLGKEKTIFVYGETRKYYVARNITYLVRRYKLGKKNPYNDYLRKRILGTLMYEEHKIKGIYAYKKGIRDGKKLAIKL